MNFDQAFTRLLGKEGGYTNNIADKGGATNWGVTQAVARSNGYTGDMRDFTQAQAKVIYRKSYWDAVQADALPDDVRYDIFDAAVNSGISQAAKWLQRAVNAEADGVIGKETIAAAAIEPFTGRKFNGYRLMMMTDLENWSTFGRGWTKRVAANLIGV
jgi:lysozyme family protein